MLDSVGYIFTIWAGSEMRKLCMDREGVGVSKREQGGWYLGNSEPYIFLTGQGVVQPQVMKILKDKLSSIQTIK